MTKKYEEYPWMCPEPFTSMTSSSMRTVCGCCVIDEGALRDIVGPTPNLEEDTFSEAYLHPTNVKLRKAFVDNDRDILDKVCKTCVMQEKAGVRSHRMNYTSKLSEDIKEHLEGMIENYDQIPPKFETLDVTGFVGNVCNLACNMCGSWNSTKYTEESYRLQEISSENKDWLLKVYTIEDRVIEDLEKNLLPKTKQLKATGGEPLYSKQFFKLLNSLSKETKSNLEIKISTNLTNSVEKFSKLAHDFKSVYIHISVEGVGEVNNYIRHYSDWNTIVENYKLVQQLKEDFKQQDKHLAVVWCATVNALNIGYLPQLIDFVLPLDDSLSTGSLVTNNEYSLTSIPPDVQELYKSKLVNYRDRCREDYLNYLQQPTAEGLWSYDKNLYARRLEITQELINLLDNNVFDPVGFEKLTVHIKSRDQLRGTKLIDVFPEWEPHYYKT